MFFASKLFYLIIVPRSLWLGLFKVYQPHLPTVTAPVCVEPQSESQIHHVFLGHGQMVAHIKRSRAVMASVGVDLLGAWWAQGGSFILIPLMTSYVQILTRIAVAAVRIWFFILWGLGISAAIGGKVFQARSNVFLTIMANCSVSKGFIK